MAALQAVMVHNLETSHAQLLDRLGQELGTNPGQTLQIINSNTGRGWGIVLSLAVHALLLAVLAFNVRWNTTAPEPYEAVLWSSLPGPSTNSAPKAQPSPKPAKEVKEAQKPEQKPEPIPKKPDIAINKKPDPKKTDSVKTDTKKPEPKKLEQKPEPKLKSEQKPETKPDTEKIKEKSPSTDTLKKLREEELARAFGGLPNGKTSGNGATGRNTAQYSDKIRQHVRSRIVFPGAASVEGNPQVVFEVRQLPTGEIVGIVQKQSSGNSAWDNAVERALQRSSPLPKADDGSVETILVMSFRVKEQGL